MTRPLLIRQWPRAIAHVDADAFFAADGMGLSRGETARQRIGIPLLRTLMRKRG